MLKISLYHTDLIPFSRQSQKDTYGKSQINYIKGFRTPVIGNRFPEWFQPLFPNVLLCRTTQINRTFKQCHKFADGNVACVRELLGKAVPNGGINGLQTHPSHGRKPIIDCTDEEVVRKAIEEDRQIGNKVLEIWKRDTGMEASDLTFNPFLSALAQNISE